MRCQPLLSVSCRRLCFARLRERDIALQLVFGKLHCVQKRWLTKQIFPSRDRGVMLFFSKGTQALLILCFRIFSREIELRAFHHVMGDSSRAISTRIHLVREVIVNDGESLCSLAAGVMAQDEASLLKAASVAT